MILYILGIIALIGAIVLFIVLSQRHADRKWYGIEAASEDSFYDALANPAVMRRINSYVEAKPWPREATRPRYKN